VLTVSQKSRNLPTRFSGGFPAMRAELIAPIEMPATQSGWRSASASFVNPALIGTKGAAALQDQRDPLERRTLGRDMGLAQQRLAAGHEVPPPILRVAQPFHALLKPSFRFSSPSMQFHVWFGA
jgi:hypothetical protein